MKIPHIFFLTLTFLFLFSACKKEFQPTPGAFGRVTEFGTEKPIANARMELYKCNSDGFASACFLTDSVFTDSEGRYQITYDPEEANYHVLTPVAERYFAGAEKILNSGLSIEQDFVLDPFAWLSVRVVNEAPAGEFDKIRLTFNPSGGGWREINGAEVDEFLFDRIRGNRTKSIQWKTYDAGTPTNQVLDSVIVAAHDTLYYEIRY